MHNDIKFDIIDTCPNINTDNEAISIRLKNTEDQITITTVYIPPASSINASLRENIKNSADNIIITGDLNAKHTNFNCNKTDRWGMALKKHFTTLISLLLITAYLHTETAEQTLAIKSIM